MPLLSPIQDLPQRIRQEIKVLGSGGGNDEQKRALGFLQSMPLTDENLCLRQWPAQKERMNYRGIQDWGPSDVHRIKDMEDGSPVIQRFGTPPNPIIQHEPRSRAKLPSRKETLDGERCILGQLSVYNIPIGLLTVGTTSRMRALPNPGKAYSNWSYDIEFSLFPPTWIANRVVTFSMSSRSTFGGAPSLNWNIRQTAYNSSPLLATSLKGADIPALQRLFWEGEARPTDCLAPWGNSLLHVIPSGQKIKIRANLRRLDVRHLLCLR